MSRFCVVLVVPGVILATFDEVFVILEVLNEVLLVLDAMPVVMIVDVEVLGVVLVVHELVEVIDAIVVMFVPVDVGVDCGMLWLMVEVVVGVGG